MAVNSPCAWAAPSDSNHAQPYLRPVFNYYLYRRMCARIVVRQVLEIWNFCRPFNWFELVTWKME